MDLNRAALCLEKLGNPTRLQIFRLLVRAGPEGAAVGEVQAHLSIPGSTLSHHLSQLVQAGLIEQRREGRVLRCIANFELMQSLVGYLSEECCVGLLPSQRAG